MHPTRLLVVDDAAPIRFLVSHVLTKWEYDVRTTTDGGEALALLDGQDFDVVLSDLNMPGVDGLALLQTLRQRGCTIPVILMSADKEVAAVVGDLGAVAFVPKSIALA
jgi:two-component system, response regulator FlrC